MASKLVLVTGASSGIGAATAKLYGASGAHVLLLARNEAKLNEVAAAVRRDGGAASPYAVDLADANAIAETSARIKREAGTPDIVINNAGAGRWLSVLETSAEEALAMIEVPYLAAFNLTRAFLPEMIARGDGAIACITSPASYVVWPNAAAYTAARHALLGFTEVAPRRPEANGTFDVTLVVLGQVETPYWEHNPGSREHMPKSNPILAPILTAEQAAQAIVQGVERRQRRVVKPAILRALFLLNAFAPGLVTRQLRRAVRSRPPRTLPPENSRPLQQPKNESRHADKQQQDPAEAGVIGHERQAADIHAEDRRDQARRQEHGGDDGQHLEIAIGLVGHSQRHLFLQEMRPVAQRNHLMIEPIEPLRQFGGGELQCVLPRPFHLALEAMDQRALRRQLPMQPHRQLANPGKGLMLIACRSDQHPLLDLVEIFGEAVGIALDGFDHVLDDGLQQRGGGGDLAAGAQRPARRLERVQTLPASADEELLGHGEMQEADLIGRAAKPADEIGEDAIDASSIRMQLLMPVRRQAATPWQRRPARELTLESCRRARRRD